MIYAFGAYTFDTQLYELRRAGELIPLGPQVFNVLAYLVQHRQRVVPKQELFERLWPGQYVGDDALERCIRLVRRALGDTRQAPQLIQTIRGRGYRFMAPMEVRRPEAPGDERPATPPTFPLPVSQAMDGADMGLPSVPLHVGADTRRPTLNAPEGEHKPVTVLCCELAEAKALATRWGPEALHHLMQALFALAQEVVQRYEGTIVEFGSDGFRVLFGADVAQEDHARRAVLAAVELQQHLHEHLSTAGRPPGQAPAVGIGVHTGVVVVGRLGADPQRIYTAAGETTALASCLQHLAAPGMILMSEATWQLVQDEVQVEPHRAIAVEEQSTPVPIYAFCRMTRRRSGVSGRGKRVRSPFVGRAREMAILQERLAQAQDGRGQVVGIAGEPGIGKSRLLEEFHRSLAGMPVTYCEGHCLSYGSTTPYLPVLDLLRQLCGITDADSPPVVMTQVRQQLQEAGLDPEEAAPYLLHLLGIAAGTEHVMALSPEEHKARTFACLRQFSLQHSRRHPLILAVENLHWIDATSEDFLSSLVERLAGTPILLLATYRPGYRSSWLEKSYATQLALPGLTARDSLVVVQVERLADHALRGEVWDKALAYCRQAGEKALAQSAYREAVASFEQALSVLPHLPETRHTREQAIDLRLALRTALYPSGDFGRHLVVLREAEALAEALDDPRRLAEVSRFLAIHFYHMGVYDQSIAAAQRALELAKASGDGVLHALAYYYLGPAFMVQGNYQRAIDCYTQAVASLEGAQRHERVGQTLRPTGSSKGRQTEAVSYTYWWRFGQMLLPTVSSRAYLAECHAELGTFTEGRVLGEEGLRMAEAVKHPASLMVACHGMGLLSLRQGDLPRALRLLERALRISQDADLPVLFPRLAAALGVAYTWAGRVADAVPLLTRATAQITARAVVDFQALCGLALGEAQLRAGRLEKAQGLAEHALTFARARREHGNEAYVLCLIGDVAAQRDPPEDESAEAHYRQALALAEALGMRPLQAHCHRDLGSLYAKTGQRAQAREELSMSIELYRTMGMTFWLPRTKTTLAQVEGQKG